jgi:hypothetical protein
VRDEQNKGSKKFSIKPVFIDNYTLGVNLASLRKSEKAKKRKNNSRKQKS